MKTKLFYIIICNLLMSNVQFAQNITNTLGSVGVFKIKDGSTDFFTLTQSTGQVNILKSLRLENTTSSTTGVIFKGLERFIHNYGLNNTFIGRNSGNFTMTGNENNALGTESLLFNTSGVENTAIGSYTLYNNTTGYENTAVGVYSLANNTTGFSNTAVGYSSLVYNTTGLWNTSLGYNSLLYNTTGGLNTAIGSFSLYANKTGSYNIAVGDNSLGSNTTGLYNTAVGHESLIYNTTGNSNTAVGSGSLFSNTTGNNNTALGSGAQVPSNTSSDQVRIGNTSVSYAGVNVAWTITSDRRWKQNILNSNLGLGFISKLNPVSYTRINDESGKTEYGLIAQEVEEVLKEEGVENSGMLTITDEGMYELRYNDLMAPMIKAIQELKVESEKLKAEGEKMNVENGELKSENEELKQRLLKLEQMQNVLAFEIKKMKSKHPEVKEAKLGEK